MIKVNIESPGGCRRILEISVSADAVKDDYEALVGLFAKQARISGFRRGRAPVALVERRYNSAIIQEAKDRLIPQFYQEALQQEHIEPVTVVNVQDVQFGRDEGLAFRATVDVAPEFKLPKYRKISLKRETVSVGDADVEKALNEIRERFARFEDVDDQPVALGDLVQIDYDAESDGKPLAENVKDARDIGSGRDFWVPTEESEFVPGLNAALEGGAIGDTLTVDVSFPEDYHVEAVAGQKAVYTVTVKGVRKRVLPELDEDFVKQFEVESEAALRDTIRTDLEEAQAAKETERLKSEISKILLDKTTMELPQALVERETYTLVRDMLTRVAQQGASREMLDQHRDEILGSASQTAQERVKLSYIINRIAGEEEIDIEDADIDVRLDLMGQRYGMPRERIRAELEKQDGGMQQLWAQVRNDKVMDFLLENAKVKL